MSGKDFRGEVWSNVSDGIIDELVRINSEEVDGKVGHDSYTLKATEYLQSFFDKEIAVLYTLNGTAANIIALKALLDRYGAVICADKAHINTYECGALEYNLGNKILTASTDDAKLTPKLIDAVINEHKSHGYIPQVVAITQPTELGVLYSVSEIKELADYAHKNGMKLFTDGARIGSALAALDVTLREMMENTGVDAFTVGGTKAGAMFGEAVVFTDKNMLSAGEYILKQSLQHLDKSRFLGAQMLYLFENDRYIKNFAHANEMAKLLEKELAKRGVSPFYPVESNMVFCVIEPEKLKKMKSAFDLKYWYADKNVVRFVTTNFTTAETVIKLAGLLD